MTTSTIAIGDTLPRLDLTLPDGTAVSVDDIAVAPATLIYFMRTSTCPACHHHLRLLERSHVDGVVTSARTIVVVPGDATAAAAVVSRHPLFAGRVVASETAHAAVGLFSKAGLQRSGGLVIDASGRVTQSHFGTIPTSAFDLAAATSALADLAR